MNPQTPKPELSPEMAQDLLLLCRHAVKQVGASGRDQDAIAELEKIAADWHEANSTSATEPAATFISSEEESTSLAAIACGEIGSEPAAADDQGGTAWADTKGQCCYGGIKTRADCASCSGWKEIAAAGEVWPGYIIAKQLVVEGPNGIGGKEMWTGFQDHSPRVYPSADAASSEITRLGLPLGWVRVPLTGYAPPTAQPLPAGGVDAEHVAWLRYKERDNGATTIHLCDSNAEGAFKVYREPVRSRLSWGEGRDEERQLLMRALERYASWGFHGHVDRFKLDGGQCARAALAGVPEPKIPGATVAAADAAQGE